MHLLGLDQADLLVPGPWAGRKTYCTPHLQTAIVHDPLYSKPDLEMVKSVIWSASWSDVRCLFFRRGAHKPQGLDDLICKGGLKYKRKMQCEQKKSEKKLRMVALL